MADFQMDNRPLAVDGVRELKVPLFEAQKQLAKNGLDEIYFRQGDATYVAFGDGLDLKAVKKGNVPTFNGKSVELLAVSNETNTPTEGIKKLAVVAALVTGAGSAVSLPIALGKASGEWGDMIQMMGKVGVGLTAAAGAAIVGAAALYGTVRPTDTASLDNVAK